MDKYSILVLKAKPILVRFINEYFNNTHHFQGNTYIEKETSAYLLPEAGTSAYDHVRKSLPEIKVQILERELMRFGILDKKFFVHLNFDQCFDIEFRDYLDDFLLKIEE
jgi:hypothetical protein